MFYWAIFYILLQNTLQDLLASDEFYQDDEMQTMQTPLQQTDQNEPTNPNSLEKDPEESLSVSEYDDIVDQSPTKPANYNQEDMVELDVHTSETKMYRSRLESLRNYYTDTVGILQKRLPFISFLAALFVTLISFGTGYLFSSYFLRPLNKLQTSLNTINLKNISELTKIKSPTKQEEFVQLVKSYNDMLLRVKKSYKSQKEFLQNASHELKTPLSIIQTNAELIQESISEISEANNASLESIISSVDRMSSVINDMLLLEEIEYVQTTQKTDLTKIVNVLLQELQPILKKKDIQVKASFHKEQLFFQANPILMKRLFRNLLTNAIKYNKLEGKISIISEKVRNIDRTSKISNHDMHHFRETNSEKLDFNISDAPFAYTISIEDTGVGMSNKELKNIGKRFYRADKSRSRELGGSGLGLAIVQEIVKRYKIFMQIKSKKDKGTTFILYFPKEQ
jgi:signal transduction histidine kinase